MKRNSNRVFLLLLCLIMQTGIYAQNNLILKFQNGTESSTTISDLNKLTFTSTDLLFNFTSGNSDLFPLSLVHKIVFSTISATPQVNSDVTDYQIYPNPASEFISIKNVPDNNTTINIYNIAGSLVLTEILNSTNGKINIQQLRNGFYILRVNNQALKFTKK